MERDGVLEIGLLPFLRSRRDRHARRAAHVSGELELPILLDGCAGQHLPARIEDEYRQF
jgi:hypothetical protein